MIFNPSSFLHLVEFLSAKRFGKLFTSRTSCGKELYGLTKYCMKKIHSHVRSWTFQLLVLFYNPQVFCWKRQAVAGTSSAWMSLHDLCCSSVSYFLDEKVLVYAVILCMKELALQSTEVPKEFLQTCLSKVLLSVWHVSASACPASLDLAYFYHFRFIQNFIEVACMILLRNSILWNTK